MYSARITNRGTSKHYANTRHGEFVIDTAGEGSNPIDTLLAGLCGCIGHEIRDAMTAERIAYTSFVVKAEADLAKDKTRLSDISVSIELDGVHLDDKAKANLIAVAEGCKIRNTLKANSQVNISLTAQGGTRSQGAA